MQKYRSFVFLNCKEIPDPESDIERFSGLHSWYKRLPAEGVKAFPILLRGEEPRYSFNPSYSDPDQSNFHWTLVFENCIDYAKLYVYGTPDLTSDYEEFIPDSESLIPDELKTFMRRFPIHLSNEFSECSDEKSMTQRNNAVAMCHEFWNALGADPLGADPLGADLLSEKL